MTENMAGRGEGLAGLVAAAARIDWMQVLLNLMSGQQTGRDGQPCFFVGGGHFCLRAKFWAGHDDMHKFVSLETALEAAAPAGTPDTSREALEAAEYALSHPESNQRFALVAVRAALATPSPQAPASTEPKCSCVEHDVDELDRSTRYAAIMTDCPTRWTVTAGCPIHGASEQSVLLQDFNAQFGFGVFVVTGEHQRTAFFSKEKAEQYLAQQHHPERFKIVIYPKPQESSAFSPTSAREQSSATASANLSVADLKPLKDACDRDWEDESPLQIICIAANAIYWRDVELSVLRGSSDYANGFNAGRESLSTPLTPYGERIADCLRTAVEWNDDYMRINKLYGKVDWVEWAKKLLTGNLENSVPAATQEPAGSGASNLSMCGVPMEIMGCFICQGEVKNWCPTHGNGAAAPGSPRKVGEDGAPKLRPTYYVRHPDDTFSVAEPQPMKLTDQGAALVRKHLRSLSKRGPARQELELWLARIV